MTNIPVISDEFRNQVIIEMTNKFKKKFPRISDATLIAHATKAFELSWTSALGIHSKYGGREVTSVTPRALPEDLFAKLSPEQKQKMIERQAKLKEMFADHRSTINKMSSDSHRSSLITLFTMDVGNGPQMHLSTAKKIVDECILKK